ncbi:MAG: SprT-like domain-containing protein [Bacteroidales bacterium]|nr:sprT domain-containing protein [Lentimicrobiaceae bacterium]MDG1135731.1 SprT-like domain-containing protein [Bacteroidales bacterium]MDG1902492.1 SprT-like domain-containing protein [Bacteroidales bacterium]MDG2081962.1 SprT-like domain-containing protein [Bacteroidales bacterium]
MMRHILKSSTINYGKGIGKPLCASEELLIVPWWLLIIYICQSMNERELLVKYLPKYSVDEVMSLIIKYNIHLKITKRRNTKLGDYRPPVNSRQQKISINNNLNQYSFLITFIHEVAHLMVWEKYKNSVFPHGKEWKHQFKSCLKPFLRKDIFPDDLLHVLDKNFNNPRATSAANIELTRILNKYDNPTNEIFLEQILENTMFQTPNGKIFIKGKKRRTRYICVSTNNNRKYLFHPLAPVSKVE